MNKTVTPAVSHITNHEYIGQFANTHKVHALLKAKKYGAGCKTCSCKIRGSVL